MTETAQQIIDRLQYEAGYATGGDVNKLIYSGLDVHEMLNEIADALPRLTIPADIAKELDNVPADEDWLGMIEDLLAFRISLPVMEYMHENGKGTIAIIIAYLNPLTRGMVEIEED